MTFDEWQKTTEAYRAGQKSMFGASTTKDKSIAEAIASGEDTTGLSTVRDLARIMLEKKCYWMELAMPVDGKKINLESVITCVDDVPFGSSTTYSPERKAWQASQNAKARATLDSMPYAHLKDNGDGTLTFMSPVPYSRPANCGDTIIFSSSVGYQRAKAFVDGKMTCEHCKHWLRNGSSGIKSTSLSFTKEGECRNFHVSGYIESYDGGGKLISPESFGCTLFEVKE